jgi:2,2-dialkylglycine decarboxylase (pyruvate)
LIYLGVSNWEGVMTLSEQRLIEAASQYTLRAPAYNRSPVMVRGQDTRVWDMNGKEYIDWGSGQLCATLGHNHPRIVDAVRESCETLMHTSSALLNDKSIELAIRLAEKLQPPLQCSVFMNTGSESNEVALSIAKKARGGYEAAVLHVSYTGRTSMARSASPALTHKGYGPLLPGIHTLPGPYCYRCPVGQTYPGCAFQCLDTAFSMLDAGSMGQVVAFFAEPIFGAGGIVDAPPGYFQELHRRCQERGILLVFDEAQTALGRSGDWFAYEHEGIVPDILTLSKTLGAGVPLSATVTSAEIKQHAMANGFFHSSTHAFDPLPATVGLAVLEAVERENLVLETRTKGAYLKQKLMELADQFPMIGDVRGRGFLLGMELVKDRASRRPASEEASRVVDLCQADGLLIRVVGAPDALSVLNIAPPLTAGFAELDQGVTIIARALACVQSGALGSLQQT